MTMIPALLLQADSDAGSAAVGAGGIIAAGGFFIVMMIVALVFLIGMWKVFTKAGQPGWACIVPIYNIYILTQIAGRPAWWILMFLIPFVSLVFAIILAMDVAKSFGKSAAFGILVVFGIGYLILGFGSARYVGPAAVQAA